MCCSTQCEASEEKNMRCNPKVTLFCRDPANPLRNISAPPPVVEMTEAGAVEHNDQLTMLYLGKPHFFGDAVPTHWRRVPVICKVLPTRVHVEAGKSRTGSASAGTTDALRLSPR